MTVKTLSAYFNSQLTELGYDDIALKDGMEWSLGYCQSDHVSFPNASICADDAKTLCNRLMEGKYKAAVKRALDKGLELEAGGKYSSEFNDYNCEPELTALEIEACEKFITCIDEDLKDLERRFQSEGYEFLEATPSMDDPEIALERVLGRFKLVVSKVHCEWFDLFCSDLEEDIECDTDTMKSIFDGKLKYFDLKIELFDTLGEEDDDAITCGYLGNCMQEVEEKLMNVYGDEIRETISQTVSESRSLLGKELPHREEAFAQMRERKRFAILAQQERERNERREAEIEKERKAQQLAEAKELSRWSGMSLGGNLTSSMSFLTL